MAITYNAENALFRIENARFSYVFFVNSKGVLQHLYFGKPIGETDLSSADLGWDWSKTYLSADGAEKIYEDNYYNDRSMAEVPSHGLMDKSGAQFVIEKSGGVTATSFVYKKHRIYDGKPKLSALPSTHGDDAQTLEITLDDVYGNERLLLSYTVYGDLGALIRNASIINCGKTEIRVKRAYSLGLDLPRSDFDLMHFHGDWCLERFAERKPLANGRFTVESTMGRSSHEKNPFAVLCDRHATEDTGEAYAFSFVYSGNFTLAANVDKWRRTRVLLGICDEDFSFALGSGETFEVPEGVLVYSDRGLGGVSRTMHDLVRNNLITHKKAKAARPVLFNSWEGCYLDFDTQSILAYAENAAKIGAELFVLDDGWFGKRDTDCSSLGDWFVADGKIDLKKVIDKCHSLGMKFGIWFEPEMINPDSDLYRTHPDYALGDGGYERTLSRHQLVLDTSRKEVADRLFKDMSAILDKYEIDYIKWDHNRNIGEITGSDTPYGEVCHRLILGTYSLLDRLQKKYPEIFFEGCASGGGRFDLGMLYYNPQIWTSDETDPVQRLFIQYGTSYAYPLSVMGSHISKNPITSYTAKGRIALFGTYGIEMNPCLLSESEREEVREVNEIYKKYHCEVIQNGDLYRLASPFEGNYTSMMSVSKDKSKALVLFANVLKENNRYRFIKLKGLDPDKRYSNSHDGKIHDGRYYMQIGLNFTAWLEEFTTFLVVLEEA